MVRLLIAAGVVRRLGASRTVGRFSQRLLALIAAFSFVAATPWTAFRTPVPNAQSGQPQDERSEDDDQPTEKVEIGRLAFAERRLRRHLALPNPPTHWRTTGPSATGVGPVLLGAWHPKFLTRTQLPRRSLPSGDDGPLT